MKTASAKAKGRRGQQIAAKAILAHHPHLTEDDVASRSMGANGCDIMLSQAAKQSFPYEVEVKARAKMAVYTDFEQAKGHGALEPLLILKQDRREALAVIRLDHFMALQAACKVS